MRLDYTQRHETSRNRPAIGTATPTGHSIAQGGHRSVGDCTGRGCLREFRIPVGRGLPKTGAPWIATTTDPRSSPWSLLGAEEAAGGAAPEGAPGEGLSNRFMDLETCGAADLPAVWGALPSLSCLEAPDPVGVELSEARTPSPATGRGRDRPMETVPLAPYKKTPHDVAPIWSSSMNPAFCSSPTWPAPGPRKGTPPSYATSTNRIGSRPSVRWPCRPSAGGWRSISGCVAAISRGWMSERSCDICSGICVVPLSCCGIGEPFIAEKPSSNGSPPIPGSRWKSSRPTRRNSIRRNMCGARPTAPWRTVRPRICISSTGCSATRCGACVARNHSCGPVSTRQICRGHGEPFHYLCKPQ
jgi:hypothetical protein